MNYFEFSPSPLLAPYIKTYWFLEGIIPPEHIQPERIFPDGCMELIIHYGDVFQKITGNIAEKQSTGFVFGQLEAYIELLPAVTTGVMGIKFFPHGLSLFTPVPMNGFSGQAINLEDIFIIECRSLREQVALAEKPVEKVAIIEKFLLGCFMQRGSGNELISAAVKDIYTSKGCITVNDLAKRYRTSERQLERQFARQVGLSPKTFSRIIRFQQVFNLAPVAGNLTSLALDAGYFDQAHFTREFKSFTGLSPLQYFNGQYGFASLFLDD